MALATVSVSLVALALTISPATAVPTLQYDHGDPSGEEQLLLELINRARANPAAEGAFLLGTGDPSITAAINQFDVDTGQLVQDFNSYPSRPPIAFNADLSDAAERHADDLVVADTQSHTGSDGSTPGSRVSDAGYAFSFVRENVYSFALSPVYAHAAFNIDWGPDETFGVQNWPLPGHRQAIMNYRPLGVPTANSTAEPLLTEVGMSWISAPGGTNVGPNLVVQDFATSSERFLLGVVYDDLDGDGFYSPGEGIPGVTLTPSAGDWFAVSSSSGGYAIPIAELGVGAISLTASGGPLNTADVRSLTLTGDNEKVDFVIDVSAIPATTTATVPVTTTAPATTASTAVPTTVAPTTLVPTTEAPTSTAPEIQVLEVQSLPTTTAVTTTVAPTSTTTVPTAPPISVLTVVPTTIAEPPTVPPSTDVAQTVPEPTTSIVSVDEPATTVPTAEQTEATVTDATVLGLSTELDVTTAGTGDSATASTSTTGAIVVSGDTLPITGPATSTQMALAALALLAAGLNLIVGSRQPV